MSVPKRWRVVETDAQTRSSTRLTLWYPVNLETILRFLSLVSSAGNLWPFVTTGHTKLAGGIAVGSRVLVEISGYKVDHIPWRHGLYR